MSLDGGKSWKDAALRKDLIRFSSRERRIPVGFAGNGRVVVIVCPSPRSGEVQPLTAGWNPAGYRRKWLSPIPSPSPDAHTMKRIFNIALSLTCAWFGIVTAPVQAAPLGFKLPAETAKLRPSTLPGAAIAALNDAQIKASAEFVLKQ